MAIPTMKCQKALISNWAIKKVTLDHMTTATAALWVKITFKISHCEICTSQATYAYTFPTFLAFLYYLCEMIPFYIISHTVSPTSILSCKIVLLSSRISSTWRHLFHLDFTLVNGPEVRCSSR
mgnify:FL=1